MYEYEKQKLFDYLGKDLVDLFKQHQVYVAGGIITSLFCNREINDIDVYFRSQKQMINFYEEIWGTSMWITFHTKKSSIIKINEERVIQLIHFNVFKNVNNIFDKFDFTICMGAFDFKTEEFILHQDFLKHNSQRILKFNKNTEFPIISILRLHKYKEKGYQISRAETIKMALTCVNLNINSYEELFNQVTAMSEGENLEDIIDTSKPFSLDNVLNQLENHNSREKKEPKSLPFESLDDLLISITDKKYKPQYIKINDHYLRLINNKIKISEATDIPEQYLIDANKYFKGYKFYKFVKKVKDKYFSYFDNKFEYKIREKIVPANGKDGAIFCGVKNNLHNCTYRNSEDRVAVELEINGVEDIINFHSLTNIQLKKCKFIREVPEQEWKEWHDKYSNDEIPFDIY